MSNIFLEYTEFIDTDPRKSRPSNHTAYNVGAGFQYLRHKECLPPEIIQGKRVLDLGSCVAASGAWVLANGAEKYVGVELQQKLAAQSIENLAGRFDRSRWEIHQTGVAEFLKNNTEQFDVVIMFGILYQSIYFEELLLNVIKTNPAHVIVDGINPTVQSNYPIIEYVENQAMVSENVGYNHIFNGSRISVEALQIFFWSNGYQLGVDHTVSMRSLRPETYQNRYCLNFVKSGPVNLIDFETNYKSTNQKIELMLGNVAGRDQWTFDAVVSENFESHARQHIPNYDGIINQSVAICQRLYKPNAKILDVGCATGETVKRLYANGFHNLLGVDASNDMLNKAREFPHAYWMHNSNFPEHATLYDIVLCNWTLHFIQEKREYLEKIYKNLNTDGMVIVTDKTADSGVVLDLYHDMKRDLGVSDEDIALKAESLKGVMFVNPPEWYLSTLKEIGFSDVAIINASPCFTTFLAFKR